MAVSSSAFRITREIIDLQKGSDHSLAVAYRDSNVRKIRALIIGPPDTPYEFGFFEFSMEISDDYPIKPPKVKALTTNHGNTRFNPNIYATGYLCLSILGTWRGEAGEEWSTAQGLESLLRSIQSLMSSNPYENEPGFEDVKISDNDAKCYAEKIQHESLRITVIERLETLLDIKPAPKRSKKRKIDDRSGVDPESLNGVEEKQESPQGSELLQSQEYDADRDVSTYDKDLNPFADLYKRRFLWYYDVYMRNITLAKGKVTKGQKMIITAFEHPGNQMAGSFVYEELSKRIQVIRDALDAETQAWAEEGLEAVAQEKGVAARLQRQYEQLVESYRRNSHAAVELSLVDDNPFVWDLTLFGRPMTNLDGGLFSIRIHFSVRFPEQQPRVSVLTPLFHHRISATGGVLCYFPVKQEEVKSHVEAIISAIEEDKPGYDPRTLVNPEAASLLWGGEDSRKVYSRRLRRSVQASSEGC